MQREVKEGRGLVRRVGEADKNGMSDFIFSFPTSFFAPPPLCSNEKVSQKQHLRMASTYALIEAILSMGGRK